MKLNARSEGRFRFLSFLTVGEVEMQKLLVLVLLSLGVATAAWPQELDLPQASVKDEVALAKAMPNLAKQVIANCREEDREKYLDNLFRLQILQGQYAEGITTIKALRNLQNGSPAYAATLYAQYEVFASAKLKQAAGNLTFPDAFRQSFRDKLQALDDKLAYYATGSFSFDLPGGLASLQASLEEQKNKSKITLGDAIGLVRAYQPYFVYKQILPLTQSLQAEDNARRYDIQNDVLIKTKDGATISGVVVRKKGVITPRPTALTFTIYARKGDYSPAILSAAHGYAGVLAYTRGKALSPDAVRPYEHESQDGYEVIDWITKQPWSNGQVGMFGGSYNGFTQWATAKKMHPALKTIVPYVAAMLGFGLPMENNVFLNANYGWCFYVTDNKYLDDKIYFDPHRWRSLNTKWYASGRPYREIDQVDGTPNQLYLDGGLWNGKRVVSKEWVAESTARHSAFAPNLKDEPQHDYGYGWHERNFIQVDGRVLRDYVAGGNGGQLIIVIPDLDMVVGINGGSYGDFRWYRWELDLLPQFIIPAAGRRR